MAPMPPRLKVLSVGGNAVSAFMTWRLQASNACDVTLVWKSGYEHVSQYGITFKSQTYGNERFKPRRVVRAPEDAGGQRDGAYDYVILCVKALPDVYDLASVIDSVVMPQHTCIIVNTTHALGVEAAIEERFPTNVVLSLVSNADLSQLGQSEFEHKGSNELWVGPANKNDKIPPAIQEDMAQALAMTLTTGQVDCKVSSNIRQQQYERVIGPIAFHPASVAFETSNPKELLEKTGVKDLVTGVIDELMALAAAQGCTLVADFKEKTISEMTGSTSESIMWQDFVAKRPMEIETYLGSPLKLAQDAGVAVPRIQTLYAIMHNLNIVNRQRPKAPEPAPAPAASMPPGSPVASPLPRMSSQGTMRPMPPNGMPPMHHGNGMPPPRGGRPRNSSNLGPRRGPPSVNGVPPPNGYGPRPPMGGPPNGYPGPGSRAQSRRGSMEANDLEEFSHLMLYDDIPEGGESAVGGPDGPPDMAMRERELELRQRELAMREQEMRMGRGGGGRRGPPPRRPGPPSVRHSAMGHGGFDDDDDDDDYFDPASAPPAPMIDPDNFDMMSVTSRRNRKKPGPSAAQVRMNPEMDAMPPTRGGRFRPGFPRNRSSQLGHSQPINDNILEDPLMSCSSNRYGAVDRGTMNAGSRTNSLTSARLEELQYGQGAPPPHPGMNGGFPRRTSQSPGTPYAASMRGGRPSPPNGYPGPQMAGGRPSPPDGVRQPMPRYPQGHGSPVEQVEQQAGVSGLHPPKPKNMRSLTGSASASAGSGDSQIDTEPSAHSSQSSLGARPPIGVR